MSTYDILRRFGQNSRLHRYLAYKCPGYITIKKTDYTLVQVLLALKKVISSDKLYDPQNPNLIICDEYMEDALDVKAVHCSNIVDYVTKQMFILDDAPLPTITSIFPSGIPVPETTQTQPFPLPSWGSYLANAVVARMKAAEPFDIEGYYTMTPALFNVFKTLDGFNAEQTVFQYRELTKLLSAYLMANKATLFDYRNIKVCNVANDLLGIAFGVKAFDRCQVTSLLRAQLEPVVAPLPAEVACPAPAVSCPAPPPLISPPEVSSAVPLPLPTATANNDTESDTDDEERINTTYRTEFEIDTGSNDESQPDDSSDEDSAIDNIPIDKCEPASDAANNADSEFENPTDMEQDCSLIQTTKQCLTCKEPIKSFTKYCRMCWRDRKTWIPMHRKLQRRCNDEPAKKKQKCEQQQSPVNKTLDNPCTICYLHPKNASFIHGQSSHQVCCYSCAKKIVKNKSTCPVCRRKIEKITKHFIY